MFYLENKWAAANENCLQKIKDVDKNGDDLRS